LDTATLESSKLRLLHVFNVVLAAGTYCACNAQQLFIAAWFPCLLESASRLALEWLIYSFPRRMPELLLSDHFTPHTWLTPFVVAPWSAMAWAFVLRDMSDKNHGAVTPTRRFGAFRFELSPAIVIAAAILSMGNLLDGLSRLAWRQSIVAASRFYDMSGAALQMWGFPSTLIRIALVSMVMAWIAVLAGDVLREGTFDLARAWRRMRGNRLRLIAIFFLLTIAFMGLELLIEPVKTALVRLLTDPPSWTLKEAILRYAVDFPFNMLWIVLWAVTVGIVLDGLDGRPPTAGRTPS
jgi:hypothetical protein